MSKITGSRIFKTIKNQSPLILIISTAIAVRLLSVWVAARTIFGPVDEYYVDKQAALALISGQNPYGLVYLIHHESIPVFAYFPMIAIYYAPFAYFGDIRFGNIFADVVIIISLYFIAKRLFGSSISAFVAPLSFALFPTSIWLTSVAGTNMMIGAMLLVLMFTLITYDRFFLGALMLGLALAATQFAYLVLPAVAYCFLTAKRGKFLGLSLIVAGAIATPFLLANPSAFYYDVVLYQFVRPLQANGWMSLYSVVYTLTGMKLSTGIRIGLFLSSSSFLAYFLLQNKDLRRVLVLSSAILILGFLVLPVNGFWNYLVVPGALLCGVAPSWIIDRNIARYGAISSRMKAKFDPYFLRGAREASIAAPATISLRPITFPVGARSTISYQTVSLLTAGSTGRQVR